LGEIYLTARTPGVSYTMTSSASTGATMSVAATEVTANQVADTKNLGMDDLEINGIAIRPTTPQDDKFSNTVVSSSNPAASGLALAAAINASTSLTGVTAEANPAITEGTFTNTGTPISGKQALWVNGTKIEVNFVQNETGTDRRAKVVAAINERVGQHGVTASDNGKGVTLNTDGRNLSVWFDSSQDELSAANFGLDKGGAVAQVSRIKIAGAGSAATTEKASVYVNGVMVETAALPGSATAPQTATALDLAINSESVLKNITAVVDPTDSNSVLITSNVAGTAFDFAHHQLLQPAAKH